MVMNFQVSSIRELCKLHDSELLINILHQIDDYVTRPRKPNEMIGNVESDPEYQLIVEANSIAADIDNEICKSSDTCIEFSIISSQTIDHYFLEVIGNLVSIIINTYD